MKHLKELIGCIYMSKSETSLQQLSLQSLPQPILELFTLISPSPPELLERVYTREIQPYIKLLLTQMLDERSIGDIIQAAINWQKPSDGSKEILESLTAYISDQNLFHKLA